MRFRVRITASAWEDLERLYDYRIEHAASVEDLHKADQARAALMAGFEKLEANPFVYRKAGESAFLRELLVSFGAGGYVVLYEIVDAHTVDVLAIRHQFEDDYY